jgi:hypothetical protein
MKLAAPAYRQAGKAGHLADLPVKYAVDKILIPS